MPADMIGDHDWRLRVYVRMRVFLLAIKYKSVRVENALLRT